MGCTVSAVEKSIINRNKETLTIEEVRNRKATVTSQSGFVDERLHLTNKQRFNIVKSWKGIARNIEGTGITMFLKLFENNDEIRAMFRALVAGGMFDRAHLEDSREMENHVRQVMFTLDEAIASLDDIDIVVDMLQSVGKRHRDMKSRGFDPQIFWKIEQPFLTAVKDTLQERYTDNMEKIYSITIHFILSMLIDGFNVD